MAEKEHLDKHSLKRYRANYSSEMDGVALYRSLASVEKNEKRRAVFEKLARAEERHARRWAALISAGGEEIPKYRRTARVRVMGWLAGVLGTQKVLPIVSEWEASDQGVYRSQPEAEGIPAEERSHVRVIQAMTSGGDGQESIMGRERWHFLSQGGSLRAAVFGVNDGLVSNLSLVMGFAGAEARPEYILLAGVSGLLAGAFSMAAGEYISVRSQREVFEQQIALEKQELESSPEEEEEELSLIYQAKGIPEEEAVRLARRIIKNPRTAIDTLIREELGLDPSNLGSPRNAAASSFLAFVAGAFVPVLPFLLASGLPALSASALLSCLALFGVGALLSVFTARGPLVSGLRMLVIGLFASAITYGVGWLLGVSIVG